MSCGSQEGIWRKIWKTRCIRLPWAQDRGFLSKLIFAESYDKRRRSGKIHRSINFGTEEKRHEHRLLVLLTLYKKSFAVKKPWLIPPHLRTFLADPISIWRPIEKEITLPMLNLNLLVEHTLIKGVKNLKIDFLRIYRDLRLSKMTTKMSRYNANHHLCLPFSQH